MLILNIKRIINLFIFTMLVLVLAANIQFLVEGQTFFKNVEILAWFTVATIFILMIKVLMRSIILKILLFPFYIIKSFFKSIFGSSKSKNKNNGL